MKVFLTGADGFIGSHLAEELVRAGHEVKALCIYNSIGSHGWLDTIDPEVKKHMEIVLGDIRDPYHMNELVRGQEAIMHLAALIAIPFSYVAPDMYVQTNIQGTLNLLNAARNHNVDRFIHTSTSEVYGTAQYVPMDEGHVLQGQSPYSASKI
ncbi:MAG: GDP-mannose 4,6-dehydratase, partial [Micrococcales bacterium]